MQRRKRRVAILRGGTWGRHEKSLEEGGDLLKFMFENLYPKWRPLDLFVDRSGTWHLSGKVVSPSELLHQIDVVWNTADPSFARILEHFDVPYIGMNPFPFALRESREILQNHIKKTKICLPRHLVLPAYQKDIDGTLEEYASSRTRDVFYKFGPPYLVEPLRRNKNMAVHVAKTSEELARAIYDGASHGNSLVVEELVEGKNCQVHCIKNFRGEEVYKLTPTSFIGENEKLRLSVEEKEKIKNSAHDLHYYLESPHYVKFNLTLTPRGIVYLHNFDFHPELAEDSHLSKSAQDLNLKNNHILEHILEEALR